MTMQQDIFSYLPSYLQYLPTVLERRAVLVLVQSWTGSEGRGSTPHLPWLVKVAAGKARASVGRKRRKPQLEGGQWRGTQSSAGRMKQNRVPDFQTDWSLAPPPPPPPASPAPRTSPTPGFDVLMQSCCLSGC